MLICCSRNISYYYPCWKQLCCFDIFVALWTNNPPNFWTVLYYSFFFKLILCFHSNKYPSASGLSLCPTNTLASRPLCWRHAAWPPLCPEGLKLRFRHQWRELCDATAVTWSELWEFRIQFLRTSFQRVLITQAKWDNFFLQCLLQLFTWIGITTLGRLHEQTIFVLPMSEIRLFRAFPDKWRPNQQFFGLCRSLPTGAFVSLLGVLAILQAQKMA